MEIVVSDFEIDGKKLRTYIDGKLICAYDMIFPLNAGYIGIYAFYDDKTIDNKCSYNEWEWINQEWNVIIRKGK